MPSSLLQQIHAIRAALPPPDEDYRRPSPRLYYPQTLETIADRARVPPPEALAILETLDSIGQVWRLDDGRWCAAD